MSNHESGLIIAQSIPSYLYEDGNDNLLRNLDVELSYNPSDPIAVTAAFPGEPAPVKWTWARDILISGMKEPTGDGDVHIYPSLDPNYPGLTVLDMASPNGEFTVLSETVSLAQFIGRTLQIVPQGAEEQFLNYDDELQALLSQ